MAQLPHPGRSPGSRGAVGVGDVAGGAWTAPKLAFITLHEARHTFASLMIAAGVNAKVLSTYMGHANISITFDRCGHLMPGNEDEAAALLDAYLERANTKARIAQVEPAHVFRRSPLVMRELALSAEGVGFEPTVPVNPGQRFSRPPHSSALPPLRSSPSSWKPASCKKLSTCGQETGPMRGGCR